MGTLTDRQLGERVGAIINSLVDLIAEVDGSSREEVLDELFSGWFAHRLTAATKDEST